MTKEVKIASDQDVQDFSFKAARDRAAMEHFGGIYARGAVQNSRKGVSAEADSQISAIVKGIENEQSGKVHAVPAKRYEGFVDAQSAYDAGAWLLGSFGNSAKHLQHCIDRGLIRSSMTMGNNPAGGFLVPEPLANSMLELRQSFGVAERNANVISMSDGVLVVPRLNTEVTSYYVSELGEITPSDPVLNQVKLEAKKLAAMTVFSSELGEDSVADVAQMLARSVAQSFAIAMDEAVFNGDGTSTYGGIVGLSGALAAGSRVTATGRTTFSALTFSDFEGCIGKAKVYGNGGGAWFISRAGWANSMMRLADAAGGNSVATLSNGLSQLLFLGYPVIFSSCLEDDLSGTSGKVACYFADLRSSVMIGMRRQMNVALDSSKYFSQDGIALRVTMRWDANVHDRGTASESGASVALVFG